MELTETAPLTAAETRPSGFAVVRGLPRASKVAVGAASLVLGVACFVRFGVGGRAAVGTVFCAVLALLTATDIDCRRIPNVIVLPATLVLLTAQIALFPYRTLEWVLGAFLAALFLFLPLLVVPTGMGMGDVKLAALLGAVLGKAVLVALLVGVVAGAVFSLALIAREGLAARKKTIPYGPFLAFGGVLVLLLGGR